MLRADDTVLELTFTIVDAEGDDFSVVVNDTYGRFTALDITQTGSNGDQWTVVGATFELWQVGSEWSIEVVATELDCGEVVTSAVRGGIVQPAIADIS